MSNTQGRKQLLILLATFLLPVMLVLGLYWMNWNPSGGVSHGVLVSPPRALPEVTAMDYARQPFKPEDWKDRWHLVLVTNHGCTELCQKNLYKMRQIHASLAKDIDRLQRVLLITGQEPVADVREIRRQYPDLVILTTAEDLVRVMTEGAQPDEQFYLVDPLGKVMMRYSNAVEAKDIRADLLKLFKYSWAG